MERRVEVMRRSFFLVYIDKLSTQADNYSLRQDKRLCMVLSDGAIRTVRGNRMFGLSWIRERFGGGQAENEGAHRIRKSTELPDVANRQFSQLRQRVHVAGTFDGKNVVAVNGTVYPIIEIEIGIEKEVLSHFTLEPIFPTPVIDAEEGRQSKIRYTIESATPA